jgi:hypothetical protein
MALSDDDARKVRNFVLDALAGDSERATAIREKIAKEIVFGTRAKLHVHGTEESVNLFTLGARGVQHSADAHAVAEEVLARLPAEPEPTP